MLPAPALVPVSDQSLLLVWEGAPSDAHSATVSAWFRALRQGAPPWLTELHPGYTSLLVEFDAAQVDAPEASAWLQAQSPAAVADEEDRVVEVVVRYGGADGPDLHDVAAHCGLSVDEVVFRHSEPRYRVAFLGFQPGFAYLLGLPTTLHTPRLAEPRRTVAAGSVGIGGGQTGIYPSSGPGGWRLIGRTERQLSPDWIEPGAQLRFVPA